MGEDAGKWIAVKADGVFSKLSGHVDGCAGGYDE